MARMVWKVLICLFLAVAAVQAGSITARPSFLQVPIDMTSDPFIIEADTEPLADCPVTFREVNALGADPDSYTLEFIGYGVPGAAGGTISMAPFKQTFTFRVKTNIAGVYYIEVASSTSCTDFPGFITRVAVQVLTRSITIENPTVNMKIGFPTAPYKITLQYPSKSSLTVAPSTDPSLEYTEYANNGTIKILPSPQIVIPAGALSGSFYMLLPTSVDLSSLTINWTVVGNEASYYTFPSNPVTYFLNTQLRNFDVVVSNPFPVIGQSGNYYFYAYAQNLPNTTVTLQPQAADTTFTPGTLTFNAQNQVQRFSFVTTSPDTAKQVNFYLTQSADEAWYNQPTPKYITVSKRNVYIKLPQQNRAAGFVNYFLMGNRTYMTVYITAPVASELTVSFSAAHMTFSEPSVTFSGNVTSFVVAIDPFSTGVDQMSFAISGSDANNGYFNQIPDINNINIFKGSFISPTSFYIPNKLYVGQESPQIPIRCSVSPLSDEGVTITPVADYIMFNPTSMTFRNGSEQAYFTATPLYTNDAASVSRSIRFLKTGPDAVLFNDITPITVTVSQRMVSIHWSDHLTNTVNDGRSKKRHLGKTYKVHVAANYVGEGESFTVTPTSPYYRFDPEVIEFDEDTTRMLLSVTVTGTSTDMPIDYVLGGSEGGWYTPIASDYWSNEVRPLAIERIQITPDNRLTSTKAAVLDSYYDSTAYPFGGVFTNYFSLVYLESYNVISFVIRSYVLPDNGLTITPKCAHATFSPSAINQHSGHAIEIIDAQKTPSIPANKARSSDPFATSFTYQFNFTNNYIEYNFSVNPLTGGKFWVTFELSGPDAQYYVTPPDQQMYFGVVNSPAALVAPSIALLVFAAVYAVFL